MINKKKDIIFYGAGQNAHCKFEQWVAEGLSPVCFVDLEFEKQHTQFKSGGKELWILPLEEAIAKYPDYLLYITLIPQNVATVLRCLLDEGIPMERIKFCEKVTIGDIVIPYFLMTEREDCWEERVCPLPCSHPHICSDENGISVYSCSPSDNPRPVGYLDGSRTFEEVWNSGYGKVIKCKVKNRDFSDCALITCSSRGRYVEALSFMQRIKEESGRTPLIIKFMHDFECNLRCAMCRDTIRVQSQEGLAALNNKIDNVFLPMCQNADAVYFAGNGDPFASRHYRKLIRAIAETYPHIKFLLHTNGNLCDEAHCENLGIIGRIDSVLISVNAATQETYGKVSPGARWERLMENIEWIKMRIEDGEISGLHFSFVVQKANYAEMADFVRFAQKHNATCRFTLCHWEAHSTVSRCSDNEVFHPNHPDFSEYCRILRDPVFDWEGCFLDPYSKYIRQYCLDGVNRSIKNNL